MTSKQVVLLGFGNGVQNRGILNVFPLDLQTLLEWTWNRSSHIGSHLSLENHSNLLPFHKFIFAYELVVPKSWCAYLQPF